MPLTTQEIRDPQGGRNFIRRGDTVKVSPPGSTTFKARFHHAVLDDDGSIIEIEVFGGPAQRCPAFRTVRPHSVYRVAQTKGGERREDVR